MTPAQPQAHTLLYTDIVDSTAVNTRLGDGGMAPVWAQHDRRSRDLLLAWRGREVDRSDGFMALFASTADAASFAAAYHQMLHGLAVPLKARAGLHRGPLELRENGAADIALGAKQLEVVGIAKAMSARLMALALGGQTLSSPVAAQELSALGWVCHSHGHWRMKGLDEPLEVFEIGDAGTAFIPPPDAEKAHRVLRMNGQWVSGEQVPHNLPAERDSFMGRAHDLHALAQRLRDSSRLVTLLGPGGMGKTRLALRYAWAWRASHPGGLWFCDLAQARGLDGLLQAVASALDVPLGSDPVAQLGRAIAGREHCVVILDNFEQVTRHAAQTLGRWLDAAPAARFIVTSREVLGLPGETTLALAPLPDTEAAQLFHARAHAAHAAYKPAPEDEPSVQALMDLLDGLPLAIELAAPRVRVMPVQELVSRMGDRFRLLVTSGGRPDRQATLRATLDWSWELLAPHEKSALAQMSVFEGGFGWAAAEAVLDLSAFPEAPWLVDVVQGLVDKSLLRLLPASRFGLFRSVQEFAVGHLAMAQAFDPRGSDLAVTSRRRHCRHFGALDEEAAVANKCVELDNLVLACRNSIAVGDTVNATACLALAWACLRLTGPFRVAVTLADELRQMPGLAGADSATVDWVAGMALYATGALSEALELTRRGLRMLHGREASGLAARLHAAIGTILAAQGDQDSALEALGEAHSLALLTGQSATVCLVLNEKGALAARQARVEEARGHYQSAFDLAITSGQVRWQAGLLGNLANLSYAEGQLEDARMAYERALVLAHDSGNKRWEGNARCNLGFIYHEIGRPADAQAQLARALDIARSSGNRPLEYTVLCNLGLVHESTGDITRAFSCFHAAVLGAQGIGNSGLEVQFRCCLGLALARCGNHSEAEQCMRSTLPLLNLQQDPLQFGLTMCNLAECEFLAERTSASNVALGSARHALALLGEKPGPELAQRIDALHAKLKTQQ